MTQFGVRPRASGSKFFPDQQALSRAFWLRANSRVPAIEAALSEADEPPSDKSMTMRAIADEVCREHGVTLLDLRSSRRRPQYVLARREAYWRCREETTCSFTQIGRFFNKDHTTVLHGWRKYQARLDALKEAEAADA